MLYKYRFHHTTAAQVMRHSMKEIDVWALYKKNPEMFDLSDIPVRYKIILLEQNYSLFKSAFSFRPSRLPRSDCFELFLIDPRKYRKYVKPEEFSKDELGELITRRPKLIEKLNLNFDKIPVEAWVELLKHDYHKYRVKFWEHLDRGRGKSDLRYLFYKYPSLLGDITKKIAENISLTSKELISVIHKSRDKEGGVSSISADLRAYLLDTTFMGVLAGEFKKTRPMDRAIKWMKALPEK